MGTDFRLVNRYEMRFSINDWGFWAAWGKDSKSRDLIKGTDYSIRRGRSEF